MCNGSMLTINEIFSQNGALMGQSLLGTLLSGDYFPLNVIVWHLAWLVSDLHLLSSIPIPSWPPSPCSPSIFPTSSFPRHDNSFSLNFFPLNWWFSIFPLNMWFLNNCQFNNEYGDQWHANINYWSQWGWSCSILAQMGSPLNGSFPSLLLISQSCLQIGILNWNSIHSWFNFPSIDFNMRT